MMALVIVAVMTMMYVVPMAFADPATTASITITRDSSYDGTGEGRTYNYYKVFSANYESNTSTGGGVESDGGPGAVTPSSEHAAYTATSAVAAKLGTWVAATAAVGEVGDPDYVAPVAAHWEKATGNTWFDLTPIAGTTNYSVKWVGGENPTAEDIQDVAAWLLEKNAFESGPTAMTSSGNTWTSGNIDPGYYLIQGDTGDNLIAATTNVTINEKNTYPSIDKKQKDADTTEATDDPVNVAVGDTITYPVTVSVPKTAKVGDLILVWDKATQGLTFNSVVNTTEAGATCL
mgnify:CR=1 FL=1